MTYDEAKLLCLRELPQHICKCRQCGHKVLLSAGSRLLTNLCWSCGVKEVPLGTPHWDGLKQWRELQAIRRELGVDRENADAWATAERLVR